MIVLKPSESFLYISGISQHLTLIRGSLKKVYNISTARNGFGEQENSNKTPRGLHYIRATIYEDADINQHFESRRPVHTQTDISGCILWLHGMEPSRNRGAQVDSLRRYIYIHGTPRHFLKKPSSIGCINMRNIDIADLRTYLTKYCRVYIDEN